MAFWDFLFGGNQPAPSPGLFNQDYEGLVGPAARTGYLQEVTPAGAPFMPGGQYGGMPVVDPGFGGGAIPGGGGMGGLDKFMADYDKRRTLDSLQGLFTGLLQGGAPSLEPRGFGSALGVGMAGMQKAGSQYDEDQERRAAAMLRYATIPKTQAEADAMRKASALLEEANRIPAGMQPPGAAGPGTSVGAGGTGGTGGTAAPSGGAGGGGRAGTGGWGPHASVAADALTSTAGFTPAAVQGVLANGLGEGGFNAPWVKSSVPGENSFGHWQFYEKGELPGYLAWAQGKGDPQDTRLQALYVAKRMEELHPGFSQITDPKLATDLVATKFERYKGAAPGQRYGYLDEVQRRMAGATVEPRLPIPPAPGQAPDTPFAFEPGRAAQFGGPPVPGPLAVGGAPAALSQKAQYDADIAAGRRPLLPPGQKFNSRGEAISGDLTATLPGQQSSAAIPAAVLRNPWGMPPGGGSGSSMPPTEPEPGAGGDLPSAAPAPAGTQPPAAAAPNLVPGRPTPMQSLQQALQILQQQQAGGAAALPAPPAPAQAGPLPPAPVFPPGGALPAAPAPTPSPPLPARPEVAPAPPMPAQPTLPAAPAPPPLPGAVPIPALPAAQQPPAAGLQPYNPQAHRAQLIASAFALMGKSVPAFISEQAGLPLAGQKAALEAAARQPYTMQSQMHQHALQMQQEQWKSMDAAQKADHAARVGMTVKQYEADLGERQSIIAGNISFSQEQWKALTKEQQDQVAFKNGVSTKEFEAKIAQQQAQQQAQYGAAQKAWDAADARQKAEIAARNGTSEKLYERQLEIAAAGPIALQKLGPELIKEAFKSETEWQRDWHKPQEYKWRDATGNQRTVLLSPAEVYRDGSPEAAAKAQAAARVAAQTASGAPAPAPGIVPPAPAAAPPPGGIVPPPATAPDLALSPVTPSTPAPGPAPAPGAAPVAPAQAPAPAPALLTPGGAQQGAARPPEAGYVTELGPQAIEEGQARGKGLGAQYGQIGKDAQAARGVVGNLRVMRNNASNLALQGIFAGTGQFVNQVIAGVTGQQADRVAAYELVNKNSEAMIRDVTRASDTQPAAIQLVMTRNSMPTPSTSKSGFDAVVGQMLGAQEYLVYKEKKAEQWLSDPRNNNSLAGFEAALPASPYAFMFDRMPEGEQNKILAHLKSQGPAGRQELQLLRNQIAEMQRAGF